MKKFLPLVFVMACYSCQELIDAPVPDLHWTEFDAAAVPLSTENRQQLQGVYRIGEASSDFGKEAVLKWSYVAAATDTTYYLSFFCSEDVRYFICQGKKTDTTLLLNGYWRNVENTKTGKAQFTVSASGGTSGQLFNHGDSALLIKGVFGLGDKAPEHAISFTYLRPIYDKTNYTLIAHRGGGRNNDLLPASENSVEMIPLAAQLGANGIEIDVQLTKDGVPVLFHDSNIDDRLTTKTGIHGAISSYTWKELQTDVNLKRGGKIPSLQEALETVVTKTPLEFVWLDCKYKTVLPQVKLLQAQYLQKAKTLGKKMEIVIGLPDEEVLQSFRQLPDYQNIPSLCELDTAKATAAGAAIWAPSWTKGHQDETVTAVHARGKRAFVWTVDIPDKIKEFMYRANFDGLITNRPTMAAYYLYSRQ